MTCTTERTYGINFTDDHGHGYVQRDAVSNAAAQRSVLRDYPVTAILSSEVVYTPPAAHDHFNDTTYVNERFSKCTRCGVLIDWESDED
jgi:hypothetical protein